MKALIAILLLSGCGMVAEDMATAKKSCADAGMATRWFISGLTGAVTHAQCDPTRKPEKGEEHGTC